MNFPGKLIVDPEGKELDHEVEMSYTRSCVIGERVREGYFYSLLIGHPLSDLTCPIEEKPVPTRFLNEMLMHLSM